MASYLDGLLYDPGKDDAVQERCEGIPLYSGLPHEFPQWKFRAESRILSTDAESDEELREQKRELGSTLIKG